MQHSDTDIDVALDDREAERVCEVNPWTRLFNGSLVSLILPTLVVMWADLTGRQGLITSCVIAFVALAGVAVFALVMAYRADHRTPADI